MNIVTNVRLTTAVKADASLYKQVEDAYFKLSAVSEIGQITIIKRRKHTIKQLFQQDTTPIIVFERTGPKLYFSPDHPIYFHLDTTKVKLKALEQNQLPILVDMINDIKGRDMKFSFVDGTMGFGRDSYLILKAFPNAKVYAIEQNPLIHFVISFGMRQFLDEDMNSRIHFIHSDFQEWINNQEEIVDFLYLDPMFEQTLNDSDRMGELSRVTQTTVISENISNYKKLIIKAHYKSELFKKLNAIRCIRKTSKTHYGISINNQIEN